jgi:predicted RND superfamily exporter protein
MKGLKLRWDVALRRAIEASFERWGHIAYQHPWPIIFGMALLPVALAFQLPNLTVETSVEHFLRDGHPTRVAYEAFRDQYGRDELILIGLQAPDVFEIHFLERLRALHEALEEEVPHLDEVTSLLNVRETRGVEDELIVHDLLEEWPSTSEELAALRERALANPLYRNYLLTEDGKMTTIVVKTSAYSASSASADESTFEALAGFDDDSLDATQRTAAYLTGAENSEAADAVLAITKRFENDEFSIHIAGAPMMEHELTRELGRNIVLFMSLSLLTVALFLYVLFRRLAATLLPLVVVLASIISTFGCMPLLGAEVGVPTQILPSFLLAVGVGGAVHLLTIFYQRYDGGASREEALAGALHHSGLAIVMTGITTAGGLVSFATAEIEPVAELGRFAPLGIGLGLAYCLVLLPALIAVVPLGIPREEATKRTRWIDRALLRTGDLSVMHPWTVVLCMSAVLLISILGITRLEFRYDPLSWFPEDYALRKATSLIDEKLEGSMTLEFIMDTGRVGGLRDPQMLRRLDEIAATTLAIEGDDGLRAGKTISLADVVKEIHSALNEDRPEFYAIPESAELLAQELLLFENSGTDDLTELVDSQFETGRFTILLPYSPPFAFLGFIDRVERAFAETFPKEVRVHPTGVVTLFARSLRAMMSSMIRSYLIALALITPLMFLLLGSLRGGTAAMVPNLAPIVVTLGFMGWVGIPLDLFTLLIGSIAIGLAVDDTIHFMHHFRKRYDVHSDARRAVRETLETTGRALLTTSIVLSLAFFIYAFASLTNLALFGLLTGFTIVTAFVADIGVAPALMELATRNLPGPEPQASRECDGAPSGFESAA